MTLTLFGTTTSPFANKVRISAQILGLWPRIRSVGVDLAAPGSGLRAVAPLQRIPVLVETDGSVIQDSTVICQHLDALAGGGQLLPTDGTARTRHLALAALAEGTIEAGALLRRENQRPRELQSEAMIEKHLATLGRVMDALTAQRERLGTSPDLAAITLVAGLDWIALRHGAYGLIDARPTLGDWLAHAHAQWVPAMPGDAFVKTDSEA